MYKQQQSTITCDLALVEHTNPVSAKQMNNCTYSPWKPTTLHAWLLNRRDPTCTSRNMHIHCKLHNIRAVFLSCTNFDYRSSFLGMPVGGRFSVERTYTTILPDSTTPRSSKLAHTILLNQATVSIEHIPFDRDNQVFLNGFQYIIEENKAHQTMGTHTYYLHIAHCTYIQTIIIIIKLVFCCWCFF